MKIKVEPFLMKKGNRVAKAAIEFESGDGVLAGFHLVGFTICEENEKGLFVLFPASSMSVSRDNKAAASKEMRPYFFLRPSNDTQLGELEDRIIDAYEDMISLNKPELTK